MSLTGLCLLAGLLALTPRPDPAAISPVSAQTVDGFISELVIGGIPQPVDFAFAPDGRIFVASLGGKVRIIKDGALLSTPFITLPANSRGERGLTGLALDPDFAANGYVYLYYTYETNADDPQGPKTGRLIRVTADGDLALPGSEVVLLGTVVGSPSQPSCQDFPAGADCLPADGLSHVGGALRFAPDGTLLLATGDASYRASNPDEMMLRSQDLNSLAGKVLRINPEDGSGPPDNPFFTGDPTTNRSKVWAYGLRNPFRMGLQPGSGLPFIGDVGSRYWEEINIGQPGANFGWPCYEGASQNPDQSDLSFCQILYASGTPVELPLYNYSWSLGASVTGGVFYQGTNYPPESQGAFFFGDWVRSTVSVLKVDGDNELVPGSVEELLSGAGAPVDFEVGPEGDIYYLTWAGSPYGELRHIRFLPGNRPPVASAAASPRSGPAPLTVQFSSQGSFDPEGQAISFAWDFSDGGSSSEVAPTHTFTQNGTYLIRLTVTDSEGASASATVSVIVGNQPPEAVIGEPPPRHQYRAGDFIEFAGAGVDLEDGWLPATSLRWSVTLYHCEPEMGGCHQSPFLEQTGAGGSFVAPDQGDEIFFLEVLLTVTDSVEVTDTASVRIGPDTDGDNVLDYEELLFLGTNHLDPDSDDDGTPDGGGDPDGDGLLDYQDIVILGSDPLDPDSDDNGTADGAEDPDGDGCQNLRELGSDPRQGGLRDPFDPWDYFNPTGDGKNRIDDILAVVRRYGVDRDEVGYSTNYDRIIVGGYDPWNLGPPDGRLRIDDVLAVIGQYFHDCA